MKGQTKRQYDGVNALLEAAYAWGAKVDAYTASSLPDADVVATINGQGRITHLDMRPGLQRELSADELAEAVTAEINDLSRAAEAELNEFLQEFHDKSVAIAREHEQYAEFGSALTALAGMESKDAQVSADRPVGQH